MEQERKNERGVADTDSKGTMSAFSLREGDSLGRDSEEGMSGWGDEVSPGKN
jgi:hypothetical protein